MTHQHESWNVPIKSSTAACLTELIILPEVENVQKGADEEGDGKEEEIVKHIYNSTALPLKLYFTMSGCECSVYAMGMGVICLMFTRCERRTAKWSEEWTVRSERASERTNLFLQFKLTYYSVRVYTIIFWGFLYLFIEFNWVTCTIAHKLGGMSSWAKSNMLDFKIYTCIRLGDASIQMVQDTR